MTFYDEPPEQQTFEFLKEEKEKEKEKEKNPQEKTYLYVNMRDSGCVSILLSTIINIAVTMENTLILYFKAIRSTSRYTFPKKDILDLKLITTQEMFALTQKHLNEKEPKK